MSILISAKDIYKDYKTGSDIINVLKGISYDFEEGRSYAIIGRSGSGKSTFLHILGGLLKPDKGSILFQGENLLDMTEKETAAFRRKHMGFVFQQYNLIEEYSVRNNILMPLTIDRRKVNTDFFNQVITALGLEDKLNKYPSELSGGEQQRVAIARSLIAKPELVIADEPTGNLDRQTETEIITLMKNSAKEYKQTLIVVTHNPEIADQMDVIIKMEEGSF